MTISYLNQLFVSQWFEKVSLGVTSPLLARSSASKFPVKLYSLGRLLCSSWRNNRIRRRILLTQQEE